jgi:hypothetical protein
MARSETSHGPRWRSGSNSQTVFRSGVLLKKKSNGRNILSNWFAARRARPFFPFLSRTRARGSRRAPLRRNKRWFVLNSSALMYFESEEDAGTPLKSVPLDSVVGVRFADPTSPFADASRSVRVPLVPLSRLAHSPLASDPQLEFVVQTRERMFVLRADSESEAKLWVRALRSSVSLFRAEAGIANAPSPDLSEADSVSSAAAPATQPARSDEPVQPPATAALPPRHPAPPPRPRPPQAAFTPRPQSGDASSAAAPRHTDSPRLRRIRPQSARPAPGEVPTGDAASASSASSTPSSRAPSPLSAAPRPPPAPLVASTLPLQPRPPLQRQLPEHASAPSTPTPRPPPRPARPISLLASPASPASPASSVSASLASPCRAAAAADDESALSLSLSEDEDGAEGDGIVDPYGLRRAPRTQQSPPTQQVAPPEAHSSLSDLTGRPSM